MSDFVVECHGVRYQVSDVARSVAFYTQTLGFKLEYQHLPDFATVSRGDLDLLLSGPTASGSRLMPDGRRQEPGGWNRVVLRVEDLPSGLRQVTFAGHDIGGQIAYACLHACPELVARCEVMHCVLQGAPRVVRPRRRAIAQRAG